MRPQTEVPDDVARALRDAGVDELFSAMSPSQQRDHVDAVESATQPEARARRIAGAIEAIRAWAERGAGR